MHRPQRAVGARRGIDISRRWRLRSCRGRGHRRDPDLARARVKVGHGAPYAMAPAVRRGGCGGGASASRAGAARDHDRGHRIAERGMGAERWRSWSVIRDRWRPARAVPCCADDARCVRRQSHAPPGPRQRVELHPQVGGADHGDIAYRGAGDAAQGRGWIGGAYADGHRRPIILRVRRACRDDVPDTTQRPHKRRERARVWGGEECHANVERHGAGTAWCG